MVELALPGFLIDVCFTNIIGAKINTHSILMVELALPGFLMNLNIDRLVFKDKWLGRF